ncbi:TAXI family TRAP transporter solute-binding subunit [Anaplasma platys]|uniref:TAXI family TRAP transporter solute-binding subunit n=1 Tax=Anaplasma platys TaxID=949 RepID=A0A858PY54_9RICK|nr:TAXI family TRAP transporter solute-binding subunit [Anaplasma platys]QJC27531.1 TAXI family TRAP transporter solute-binding subunit [Anaplasma platys]
MLRVIMVGFISLCCFSSMFFSNLALAKEANNREFVLIGTGSMMGVYYSIGGGVCKFVVAHYGMENPGKKLICSTSSTSGSVYNLNSIRRGAMDVGAAQSYLGYYAYTGKGLYRSTPPMKNLRLLAFLHREYLTLIVRSDSGIKTLSDIKGKRVNIGAAGTGVRSALLSIIKAKGWTSDDFLVTTDFAPSEQVQALCDGKIDVVSDFIGHPNALMQVAEATCNATIIPFERDFIEEFLKKHPYYHQGVIPGKIYASVPGDILTITDRACMYATDALPESMAYLVVRSMASNLEKLREISGALRELTLLDMVGGRSMNTADFPVPLHKGAEKFYREEGMLAAE